MIERTINGSVRKIDPADHIANLGARLIAMEKRLDEIERILAIIKINLRVSDGIESSSAEDREVQRYEVVLAAQEDVSSNLAFICDIGKRTCGFVVNYEKRTVVCLLRDRYTHKVVARGSPSVRRATCLI